MSLSGSNSDEVIDLVSDSDDGDSFGSNASGSDTGTLDNLGLSGAAFILRWSGMQRRYGAGGMEKTRSRLEAGAKAAVRLGAATCISEADGSLLSQDGMSLWMQAGSGAGAVHAGSASAG